MYSASNLSILLIALVPRGVFKGPVGQNVTLNMSTHNFLTVLLESAASKAQTDYFTNVLAMGSIATIKCAQPYAFKISYHVKHPNEVQTAIETLKNQTGCVYVGSPYYEDLYDLVVIDYWFDKQDLVDIILGFQRIAYATRMYALTIVKIKLARDTVYSPYPTKQFLMSLLEQLGYKVIYKSEKNYRKGTLVGLLLVKLS